MLAITIAMVRLRWRLLRGAIRRGGSEQFGAIVSLVASALLGIGTGLGAMAATRSSSEPTEFVTLLCSVVVLAVVGFGIVAGISQPIDPRVIAAEPLSERQRTIGLLAAAAFGPPGLGGIAMGLGLAMGAIGSVGSIPVVTAAAASWLLSLLLVARTATNLLALLASRYPRAGQLIVGLAGLVFYGLFQFVPALLNGLDDYGRQRLADTLAWTPPGQLARAMTDSGPAWLHLIAGSLWLPVLAVVFERSTQTLSLSVRRTGTLETADAEESRFRRLVRNACGDGAAGAVAWRSLVTRFRTPRTALETFTGAGVGLAAVLVPTVLRGSPGGGAVLVGGAVQLAVLFMSGNSFGNDGPAVTHELLTGLPLSQFVAGKARSIAVVAAPLAVVGPLAAAAITGQWQYLVAGFGVGVGGLLAGTGAAVVQSAIVPIAIPDSDNPFASGESGKGIVAALLLVVVLAGLAVVTIPVALALFWATDRGRIGLVTLFGLFTVAAGWLVMHAGIRFATSRLDGREPEFVASVTPAR